MHNHMYKKLSLMVALSFVVMYVFMYAMVNEFSNVFANYNQFYMAGLMASPMILIELLVMRGMYENRKLNSILLLLGVVLTGVFWFGVRQQVAIGDEQFLKSMIPHHAGAILMCNRSKIVDPEIQELCRGIIEGQQDEIEIMKNKLNEIE